MCPMITEEFTPWVAGTCGRIRAGQHAGTKGTMHIMITERYTLWENACGYYKDSVCVSDDHRKIQFVGERTRVLQG